MRPPAAVLAALVALALAVPAAACTPAPAPDAAGRDEAPATPVVYLVRHAEKVDPHPADPSDAPLTAAGRERAERLAHALGAAGITRVYSSDYRRTRDTAAPLAAALGTAVELYDPGDLPALAATLAAGAGPALVVGHSNTTPALVALLGGEPGEAIDEAGEYDRLYVLIRHGDGMVTTLRLRYGDAAAAPAAPPAASEEEP